MIEEFGSLAWRPLTIGDAKAGADILNAMEAVDKIGEHYVEEDTLQELIDPYLDLERASLGAFDGDVLVGFMKVSYKPATEEVHRVAIDGGVHPDYRRRGVGTALVKAGVAATKARHAQHHPALKLAIDVQTAEHIAGAAELFRSQGFCAWTPRLRLVRSGSMRRRGSCPRCGSCAGHSRADVLPGRISRRR
jgi:ribosomal protein S18 acetylase RimI-like enzyme